MELPTAIKLLNMYLEFNPHRHDLGTAINVVLQELDTRYNKGYQDGFQSGRYDKYVNDMYGEEDTAVKYLKIEREGYIRGYAEAWKRAKEIKEGNNEQI